MDLFKISVISIQLDFDPDYLMVILGTSGGVTVSKLDSLGAPFIWPCATLKQKLRKLLFDGHIIEFIYLTLRKALIPFDYAINLNNIIILV